MSNPNPTNTAWLRAGELADRATFYRHDLAFAPIRRCRRTAPLPDQGRPGFGDHGAGGAADRAFLANGATTIDPDGAGPCSKCRFHCRCRRRPNFIP